MPVRDTMTRGLSVAAILCGFLGGAPVAAAPITTGRQVIDINGAPMVVFTYRPGGCSDPALLMVFHGVARNARTYRDDARDRGPPLPARRRAGIRQTRLSRLALPARRHRQGRGGAGGARLDRQAGARSRRLGAAAGRAAARLFPTRPLGWSPIPRPPRRLRADRSTTHRHRECGKLRVSQPRDRRALRAGKGLFGNGGRGGAAALPGTAADHLSRSRRYPATT